MSTVLGKRKVEKILNAFSEGLMTLMPAAKHSIVAKSISLMNKDVRIQNKLLES